MAHNELVLSGWAVSPKGISGIAVQIDDRVWNASYGLDTDELSARFGGFPAVDRAGYRLAIDTSSWEPRAYYVTVAAFDVEGGRSAVEGTVQVEPFAEPSASDGRVPLGDDVTIELDRPVATDGVGEVAGPLEVLGWAHAPEGVEQVLVTLDGALQYEALRPVARTDLLERLGADVAAGAGFALRIHPSECPPGTHTLTVVAVSRDGRTAGVERRIRCVPETVEWAAADAAAPILRDGEPAAGDAELWQSRALLAESDAALARAEANLARTAQERTLRRLRETEAELAKKDYRGAWDRPRDIDAI